MFPDSGPMGVPLLSVRQLTKSYGPKVILEGVDLALASGSLTVVTGPNGSGKSTLLRCLAGVARHTGEVLVEGVPIADRRSRIGYLPQAVGLPEWATVGEVLEFFARLRGANPGESVLAPEFLPDCATPIRVLSGGQVQRVSLAVALLGAPSVLLLDEPTASLDDGGRAALWEAVDGLMERGSTVLVAAPSGRPEKLHMADTVMSLSEGRLERATAEVLS